MEKKKRTKSVEKAASGKIATLLNSNTVIGETIVTASGFQVIPFTKVTLGQISGSGEYGETKIINEDGTKADGTGIFMHLKPEGFLVDDGTSCKLLNVTNDPLSSLIEKASEILDRMAKRSE